MEPDRVFIDIRTCDLTLSQVMAEVERLQAENPDMEIFMDGDLYAIVGRRRRQRWAAGGSPSGFTTRTTRTSGSPTGASSPALGI